jgi:hypothetical protein
MARRAARQRNLRKASGAPTASESAALVSPEPEVFDITQEQMLLGMFLGALDAGKYDDKLDVIAKWVERRRHDAEEERAGRALMGFRLGDAVIFIADPDVPPALHGVIGDIVAFEDREVVVNIGGPIGRFRSGPIRCAPRALVTLKADANPVPE